MSSTLIYLDVTSLLRVAHKTFSSYFRSFQPLFPQIFFLPFSLSHPIFWRLLLQLCPTDLSGFACFFSFFFLSVPQTGSLQLPIFKFAGFFLLAYLNLMLKPYSELFILVTALSNSTICIWFLTIIFISLLTLSIR